MRVREIGVTGMGNGGWRHVEKRHAGLGEEVLMAAHGENEHLANLPSEQGGKDGGADCPDDQGVPLPLPQQVNQLDRMTMAKVQDIHPRERKAVRMKENDAGMDKRQKQQPLQRRDDVDADLRSDVVEPKGPREEEHDDGGETEERIDPDYERNREAPGQALRADTMPQQAQQGPEDAASELVANALRKGRHSW